MREINYLCDICKKRFENEEDVATQIMIGDGPTGTQSDFCQVCTACTKKIKEVIAQLLK